MSRISANPHVEIGSSWWVPMSENPAARRRFHRWLRFLSWSLLLLCFLLFGLFLRVFFLPSLLFSLKLLIPFSCSLLCFRNFLAFLGFLFLSYLVFFFLSCI